MPTMGFVLAIILCLVHFFSESIKKYVEKYHEKILSFSAGIFITFIFLSMFPEFFKTTRGMEEDAFILLLLGFVTFHILEKYLYQHVKNKKELMKDVASLHTLGFFFDQFVAGMLLLFAYNTDNLVFEGIIFIPLLLHTISSTLSLQHIFEHFNKSATVNVFLSTAPLLGALFVFSLDKGSQIYQSVFSFSLGTIFYVATRDMVPGGAKGKTKFFIAGVIVCAVLVTIATAIQKSGLAV